MRSPGPKLVRDFVLTWHKVYGRLKSVGKSKTDGGTMSSARDYLVDVQVAEDFHYGLSTEEERDARRSAEGWVDQYAHELAQVIRSEAEAWDGWTDKQESMRHAADLIDPYAKK